MTDTLAKVTSIIAAVANRPAAEIKPKTRLVRDLEMDSLDLTELEMELEGGFDLTVDAMERAIDETTTVGDVARIVGGLVVA